jgi:hypothetical protein
VLRIAERDTVRGHYPTTPVRAIDHVLWALHRMAPHLAAGDDRMAFISLSGDLAGYEHPRAELTVFALPEVAGALPAGEIAVADLLDCRHLLYREPACAG